MCLCLVVVTCKIVAFLGVLGEVVEDSLEAMVEEVLWIVPCTVTSPFPSIYTPFKHFAVNPAYRQWGAANKQ